MSEPRLMSIHHEALINYLSGEKLPQTRYEAHSLLDALLLARMPLPMNLALDLEGVLSEGMPGTWKMLPTTSPNGIRYVAYKGNAGLMVARALLKGQDDLA